MKPDIAAVVEVMERIHAGGEASFEEVQNLNWHVSAELDPFVQKIYRELQMFASDQDIRMKDPEYDAGWRSGIEKLRRELTERLPLNDT
jgi:hypothetical protein